MTEHELKERFKKMALNVIFLCKEFPPTAEFRVFQNQIIPSDCSAAANYRAACRARSDKDFLNKLGIVEEEIDETNFWADMIMTCSEKQELSFEKWAKIQDESSQLTAITVASINTKKRKPKK